jgi:hypothetical protein
VGRQGCMFGRSNICVAEQRQRVAVPAERQFRRPAEKAIKVSAFCMSDMRKIKTNLVTFVTDNFLLLRTIGDTDFLRAGGKQRNGGAAHRKRKRKRWRCDNGRGNSADLAMVRQNPRRRSQIQNARLDGALVGDLIATGTPRTVDGLVDGAIQT